jgi:hypothetical protein
MRHITTKRWKWLIALSIVTVYLGLSGCGNENPLGGDSPVPPSPSPGSNPPTASLSGRLTRADNPSQGLANAVVTLSRRGRSDAAPLLSVRTDADGNYTFRNIPPDEYVLQAQMPDGSYQPIQLPIRVVQEVRLDLNVIPAGFQIGNIEIVLPATDAPGDAYTIGRQYQFTARVYDTTGRELTGWQPNWSIVNGVGSINNQGLFRAASIGTGEVVAYFYVGAQAVQFRKTIRVSEPAELQGAPWILVPHRFQTGWGLRAYDARTKRERRNYEMYLSGIYTFSIDDAAGVVYALNSNTVTRLDLKTGAFTSFAVNTYPERIVALGEDRVLLYDNNTDRLSVYDGRTGNQLHPWTRVELVRASHMVLGADGRIYCTGRFQDGNRTFDGMIRYRLEGNAPVFDAKLAADGIWRRGIAFARNGDMLVCEGRTIQAYTTEGARLGRGFNLPFNQEPYSIHAGRGVLTENDEVFFVNTNRGIWRIRYDGSAFSLIPADGGEPFLKMDTMFLIWNNPSR